VSLVARVRPAAGEATGALVLLHGRGADENDLFPLLDALDPERRVVGATPRGGFSQGGAMTYALGLGAGRPRPAALVVLSSFIPTVAGLELDLSPPLPPLAIGHGTRDNVIGVEWGRRARAQLDAVDADVLYRETPMFHQIDPYFVRDVGDWLRTIV
jgi:phospholipase/carboxylesterase